MRILITGRAGSGKSTVMRELRSRGYNAFDTDEVPDLSRWIDKQTGQPTTVGDIQFVDVSRYYTAWDRTVLEKFLAKHNDVFMCGSSGNDLSFEDLFDRHFVLQVEPQTQIHRLLTRTDNDYGKDPRMHAHITAAQKDHVESAQKLGAITIDAEPDAQTVVDTILAKL